MALTHTNLFNLRSTTGDINVLIIEPVFVILQNADLGTDTGGLKILMKCRGQVLSEMQGQAGQDAIKEAFSGIQGG